MAAASTPVPTPVWTRLCELFDASQLSGGRPEAPVQPQICTAPLVVCAGTLYQCPGCSFNVCLDCLWHLTDGDSKRPSLGKHSGSDYLCIACLHHSANGRLWMYDGPTDKLLVISRETARFDALLRASKGIPCVAALVRPASKRIAEVREVLADAFQIAVDDVGGIVLAYDAPLPDTEIPFWHPF